MDDLTFANVREELNNPNSPYYLGSPSTYEKIQDFLRSYNNKGINTNYFGGNAKNYLSRAESDYFIHNKMMNEIEQKNKFKAWTLGIGMATAAGLAYIFRGKIPLIGRFLKKH